MARAFDDASSHYLEYAGAVVTAVPLTLAAWFNSDDTTVSQVIASIGISNAGNSSRFMIFANGTAVGDPVSCSAIASGGTGGTASSSAGYTANTWYHACGVFSANNARAAYINGGSKGTETTSATPSSLALTNIGVRYATASRGAYFSGKIAEVGVWNVALSDDDVLSLGRGMAPSLIRPDALVAYWPLFGKYSPEVELFGGAAMTVNSATTTEHPKITYPSFGQSMKFTTAVGGGATWAPQLSLLGVG